MATQNLNQMTNAVLTATNAAATQDRIGFGVVASLATPPAVLSHGRLPSPSSHEPSDRERHPMYARADMLAAKRAGRSAGFSGTLACLGRFASWQWRNEAATPAIRERLSVRGEVRVVGRVGSGPVACRRVHDGRDYLSHGCRGEQGNGGIGRYAAPVRGPAPTALRGK
jgi:hypothetical protein